MTLDALLKQYEETTARKKRILSRAETLHVENERITQAIKDQINQDFGRFVDDMNAHLPKKQRVTKWHTNYDASERKAFITITRLGGKPYSTMELGNRQPLPPYLETLKRFDREYPVKVSFDVLNYAYLDTPLEEMK